MGVAKINWPELDKESSGLLYSKERGLGLKVWRGSREEQLHHMEEERILREMEVSHPFKQDED